MAIVLVFGTSTTYGAWDTEGGWVQRLRRHYDLEQLEGKRDYILIYNLGIDGDTSEGVLKRFEDEAKRRLWPDEETILIFALGTNDGITKSEEGENKVAESKFEENLIKIIAKARKITKKIVFMGNKPIDESKTQPVSWDKKVFYKEETNRKYDKIIKKVCEEEKVYFIDISGELKTRNFKQFLDDGVHPNSEGHKIIFEIVRDFLEKKKII